MFFPRQVTNSPFFQTNPFSPFGAGGPYQVPPVFFPIPSPAVGLNPYSIGAGVPWTNPISSLMGPIANTFGIPGLIPPVGQPLIGSLNPISSANLTGGLFPSGSPQLTGNPGFQPGVGQTFQFNPALGGSFEQYSGGQPGVTNPMQSSSFSPFSIPLPAGGQPGVANPIQWGGSLGVGLGSGLSPGGGINPVYAGITHDPYVFLLLSQQLNQPPIRPLLGGQQFGAHPGFHPFASPIGQPIDPYTLLAQAQLISQLSMNPYQQAFRPYAGTPWQQSPGVPGAGQFFQQPAGLPFGM